MYPLLQAGAQNSRSAVAYDDSFADVERIELPVRHARHDILIEELARVEHPSEVSTLKVLLEGVRPHGGAAPRNESKARRTRLALGGGRR